MKKLTMLTIYEPEVYEEVKEILRKEYHIPFAQWVREQMQEFLKEHK
jgi:hypothetical protein